MTRTSDKGMVASCGGQSSRSVEQRKGANLSPTGLLNPTGRKRLNSPFGHGTGAPGLAPRLGDGGFGRVRREGFAEAGGKRLATRCPNCLALWHALGLGIQIAQEQVAVLKRVLIVEDDPSLRTVIRLVLEPKGFVVSEAAYGTEALAQMSENRPDIVLADLKLPVLSGQELVRRMRFSAELRSIPVVIITGNSDAKHSSPIGDAVLIKPFEPAELLATIERLTHRNPG